MALAAFSPYDGVSNDGGRSWTIYPMPAQYSWISCGDASHCDAVNGGSSVAVSADGGVTWQTVNPSAPGSLSVPEVSCGTGLHCVAVGGYSGSCPDVTGKPSTCPFVAVSDDGGATWTGATSLPDPPSVADWYVAVSCPDAHYCMAVTQFRGIDSTTDGGATWQRVLNNNGNTAEWVTCPAAGTCMAESGHGAYGFEGGIKTGDNGGHWFPVSPPTYPTQVRVPPACPTVTECHIANSSFMETTFDFGQTWHADYTIPTGVGGIACGTPHQCIAVGSQQQYPGTTPVGSEIMTTGSGDFPGYWLAGSDGGVFTYGAAGFFGSAAGRSPDSPVVGIAPTTDGGGYWLATADGHVFNFGDAASLGQPAAGLTAPVVAIVANHNTNGGYWVVGSDGNVYPYGGAVSYGSMTGTHLNAPVVGMAATPDGDGYWLAAADGGVFSFGDAKFLGSAGNIHLNQPVVGIESTPTGDGYAGYTLVARDGGIFTYGFATFYGSTGGMTLNKPIIGMVAPDGGGYWLVASDGGVFSFGDANFFGSAGALPLAAPIAGMG